MIRINLIPPEILQARKDEAIFKWVWLTGVVISVLLVIFWGFMYLQIMGVTNEVRSIQDEATRLEGETSRFAIFQQKEADLGVRRNAVTAASQGRIDWARLLHELGLVLPTDVYLTSFTGADSSAGGGDSVVTMAGKGLDEPDDTPDNGYKSIAKMLVRLSDMQQLDSVWLTNMAKEADTDTQVGMLNWAVNAKITSTAATSTAGN